MVPETSQCYSYEDDQQGWTKLADMNTQRYVSSSIKIPGGILVTGGNDGSNNLKTSEIIFINGTVKQGKSLPEPRLGTLHGRVSRRNHLYWRTGWKC